MRESKRKAFVNSLSVSSVKDKRNTVFNRRGLARKSISSFLIDTLCENNQYFLHMKQIASRMMAWFVLTLSLVIFSTTGVSAQSSESRVEQKGNVFIKVSTKGGNAIKTNYLYQDSKGNIDTIYLSPNGKAFVWRVSKNGNRYRKYLPEITAKLSENGETKNKSNSRPNRN